MRVKDAECASVSFPDFFELMNGAGAGMELKD
jgi:5-enolpyruvylshikimate-3-phosphate synthase